jgi:hypothetical protein
MMPEKNVGGRDRKARALLATLLGIIAIGTLIKGNRTLGFIATVGAIGFGINAVTCFCGLNETLGIDTTEE